MDLIDNTLDMIGLSHQEFTKIVLGAFAFLVLNLLVVVVILIKIPKNYFLGSIRSPANKRSRFLQICIKVAKNLLGIILIIAGTLMIFLPGQGLISILIGIILIDLPGKRNVEIKIISQPRILSNINKLRQCFGKESLIVQGK